MDYVEFKNHVHFEVPLFIVIVLKTSTHTLINITCTIRFVGNVHICLT